MEELTIEAEQARVKDLREKINKAMQLLGFKPVPDIDGEAKWSIEDRFARGDEKLYVAAAEHTKWRLEVSGSYPRNTDNTYIDPYGYGEKRLDSINISSDKSPDQITKDIDRRLLPEYRVRLAKVQDRIRENNVHEDMTRQVLADLKGAALTDLEARAHIITLELTTGYGSVKVSGDSIAIELSSVDNGLAKKILALLPKASDGGK